MDKNEIEAIRLKFDIIRELIEWDVNYSKENYVQDLKELLEILSK